MLCCAVAALALLAQPPADPGDVESQLRRAKNEYAYGNYEQAATQLRALIYPMTLTRDEQVIEARKYLALSYYLLGKNAAAAEELTKLLYLSPDFQFDPYAIAPPVIEFLEIIRDKLKPELDAIRQRKSDDKLLASSRVGFVRIVEQTFYERSEFATLMPFGVGQFQNGDAGLGVSFALGELALLGANLGAYLWTTSLGDYSAADRRLAQSLTIAQYASAGLFGLLWSFGVFQARLNFAPLVVGPRNTREEALPQGGQRGGAPAGAPLLPTMPAAPTSPSSPGPAPTPTAPSEPSAPSAPTSRSIAPLGLMLGFELRF